MDCFTESFSGIMGIMTKTGIVQKQRWNLTPKTFKCFIVHVSNGAAQFIVI